MAPCRIGVAVLFVLLLAARCGKMDRGPSAGGAVAPADPAPAAQAQAASALAASRRAMAVTVTTSLRVGDVPAAVASVRAAVARLGGYVSDGRVNHDGEGSASLEIKVPAKDIGTLRAELAKVGDVISDSEHVEDVTDPILDLDARLSNARAHERRLLELLANRAGSLSDVVALEGQIAHVREGIEQMEAQRRGLGARVELATVKVEIAPRALATPDRPGGAIGTAAANGLRFAWSFVIGAIVVFLSVAPTLSVIACAAFAIYFLIRVLSRRARRLPKA
jgi:hypothetical protein